MKRSIGKRVAVQDEKLRSIGHVMILEGYL